MEPNSGPSPQSQEVAPAQNTEQVIEGATTEQVPAQIEVAPQHTESVSQGPTVALPPLQQQPVVAPTVQSDNTDDNSTQSSSLSSEAPAFADDVDDIEKEWVDKAKIIVDQTKEDPYTQNKEVSVLKADYMKKRYGKDIKIAAD